MTANLIDTIYEAAIVPELWPVVLDAVAAVAAAEGAVLIAQRGMDVAWLSSASIKHYVDAYFETGLAFANVRTERLVRLARPGFVTDYDVFTPEDFERDPVISGFFRPRGLGWGVATAISAPSGDNFIIHCERRFASGPVNHETVRRLDVLRPHLARAAVLSSRLDMMRAQATVQALHLLGLPAVVVSQSWRMLAANDLMADLIPRVVQDGNLRMRLSDLVADVLLEAAFGAAEGTAVVQSIPIRSSDGIPNMVGHVIPIRGAGHDILGNSRFIIIITPLEASSAPVSSLLQGLFDLTPAEAHIAARIGSGETIAHIASTNKTSLHTVRTQLRTVMQKTGCSRQAELVLLLTRLSPIAGIPA